MDDLGEMVIYVVIMVVLGIISMVKQAGEKAKARQRAQGAVGYGERQAADGAGDRSKRASRRKEEYEVWRRKREEHQAVAENDPVVERPTSHHSQPSFTTQARPLEDGESFWEENAREDYELREEESEEHRLLTRDTYHKTRQAKLAKSGADAPYSQARAPGAKIRTRRVGLLPARVAARLSPIQQAVVHGLVLDRPQRGPRRHKV